MNEALEKGREREREKEKEKRIKELCHIKISSEAQV